MTTATNKIELKAQRHVTMSFINTQPHDVVLCRKTRYTNERLGVDTTEEELPAQRMRLLHAPPRRRARENSPPNETFSQIPFAKDLLMCRWDADIQLGDVCTIDGTYFQVTYVFNWNDYEIIANLQSVTQAGNADGES